MTWIWREIGHSLSDAVINTPAYYGPRNPLQRCNNKMKVVHRVHLPRLGHDALHAQTIATAYSHYASEVTLLRPFTAPWISTS